MAPIIEAIAPRLTTVERYHLPRAARACPEMALDALAWDELLAGADGDFAWVEGDERDACGICYTSGTTGEPKGVVYSSTAPTCCTPWR
jgi:fatty-acyl-CoA synthase